MVLRGGQLGLDWILGLWNLHWSVFVALGLLACSAPADEGVARVAEALCQRVRVTPGTRDIITGSVTLTAQGATCGPGEIGEYRFFYSRAGESLLHEIRGWSTDPVVTWDTHALAGGRYQVTVYARAQGSVAARESRSIIPVLLAEACALEALTPSLPSPQSVGASVDFVASARCTSGAPEYRFLLAGDGEAIEERAWDSSSTFHFDTTARSAGIYVLTVQVRRVGNGDHDAQMVQGYQLGETCGSAGLKLSPGIHEPTGTVFTATARASCTGSALPEFRFSYRLAGAKTFTLIRDFDLSPSATWNTAGFVPGSYQFQVEIRANDFAGPTMTRKRATVTVTAPCYDVALGVSPSSPSTTALTLSATPACFGGTPEVRFLYRAPTSDELVEFQAFSPATTATFPTTGLLGEYAFIAEARLIDSAIAATPSNEVRRVLGGSCHVDSLSATRPFAASTNIDVTATGSCDDGGAIEYQFFFRASGTAAWLPIRAWGGANASWDTSALATGEYELRADARGQSRAGPIESRRSIAYKLCAPGFARNSAGVCVDVDECTLEPSACDPLTRCTNTPGSRSCGACPAGYSGSGEAGCIPNATPDNQYVQVAAGFYFTCGLRVDGSVRCWGYNVGTPPPGPFVRIMAGYLNACGFRADGTLECWGDDSAQQLSVPPDSFTDLAIGRGHLCGIRTDGTLVCWGNSLFGETSAPPGRFIAVAAGASHTCAVREDAKLLCWGWNDFGQTPAPKGQFKAVSAGNLHTCALALDGHVECWGRDDNHLLAPPAGPFTSIASGEFYACGRSDTGKVACWGAVPPRSSVLGSWSSVATGNVHFCALHATHAIRCWGYNGAGETQPPTDMRFRVLSTGIPRCFITDGGVNGCWGSGDAASVAGPSGEFVSVSAGASSACWLAVDGTPSCLGTNIPAGRYGAISLLTGYPSCAIRLDRSIACWNDYGGELPAAPAGSFDAIAVGNGHACAVRADGALVCWGNDDRGQSTPPTGVFRALASSYDFSCALRTDDTVACWGRSLGNFGAPVLPAAPSGAFSSLTVGIDHACGLRPDGTAECWGGDVYSTVTPPPIRFKQLGLGQIFHFDYACARRLDDTLACWNALAR